MAEAAISANGYVEVDLKDPDQSDVVAILAIAWRYGFPVYVESNGNDRKITVYCSGVRAIQAIGGIAQAVNGVQ
ncbi:hypothetical protein [Streptomyces sp. NPDC018031]|uniref:hypothetical protein n=1 Tax=Streptomyces sp. NPDC018031 TaxID=3365033 RepID=UPI003798A545